MPNRVLLGAALLMSPLATVWATPQRAEGGTDVSAIMSMARAAGGAYAADVILKVVPRLGNADRATAIGEAFTHADGATEPYPVGSVAGSDTVDGKIAQAAVLRLDRLSLQVRAVHAMVSIDPPRARLLFDRLVVEPLSTGCDDQWVYQLGPYYGAGAAVVNAMSVAERKDGLDLLLAQRIVSGLKSAWHVDGVVTFLSRVLMDREKTDLIFAQVASQLRDGAAVHPGGYVGLLARVQTLTGVLGRAPNSRTALLRAIHEYVRQQGSASRCGRVPPASSRQPAARRLTRILCGTTGDPCPFEILQEDLEPRSFIPNSRPEALWQKPAAIALRSQWDRLVYADNRGPRRAERDDQRSDEWQAAFAHFMSRVRSQRPSDLVAVLEHVILLRRIIPGIPSSQDRLRVLQDYVTLVGALEQLAGRGQLWFQHAKAVLEMAPTLEPSDQAHLQQIITADPVLSVYASVLSQAK